MCCYFDLFCQIYQKISFFCMVLIVFKLNDALFILNPKTQTQYFAIEDMFNSDSKLCDLFNAGAHMGNSIPANYKNGCL